MINLSIIIPVFNVATYLPRCLKSLVKSDLTNTEILLIDDGSTDKSGIISEEFSLAYKSIKIIHKKNGGPSSARNLGIEKAKGKWITFVDADDLVVPNYVNILNCICGHARSDIIMFQLKNFENENVLKNNEDYTFDERKLHRIDKSKALYNLTTLNYGNFSVNKIYKKSLFSNIKFPNRIAYEDLSIMYKLIDICHSVCVYDQILYLYRQHKDSLSHSQKSQLKKEITGMRAAYEFFNYLQQFTSHSIYIEKAIKLNNYFMFSQYLDFFYIINILNINDKNRYLDRVKFINNVKPSIRGEGVKVTFGLYLCNNFPRLFIFVYGKLKNLKGVLG